MTRLIIVCGLPGTGKTTLANELSKKLHIFCLHKDSLKESLYESLHMSSLEESKKLGFPCVKAILDLAEENISKGIDVIIESPFNYVVDGELFAIWKERYTLDIFTIVLQLDDEKRRKRMAERNRHISHHDAERVMHSEKKADSYKHMPESKIFLDARKQVNVLVEEVVLFLS